MIPPRLVTMMMMGGPAKAILDKIEIDEKENFTRSQIETFKSDPELYREFVKAVERDLNGVLPIVRCSLFGPDEADPLTS